MADRLITQVQELLEGPIDFEGQKKTEVITTWMLIITGLLAFFVGYVEQKIHYTFWIGLLGTILTFVMVVPPWPLYNEDPEPWLAVAGKDMQGTSIEVDGKKVN